MSITKPVLAFDTAMGQCSVAIWNNNMLVAAEYEHKRNQQTTKLLPIIRHIMEKNHIGFNQLGAIATTSGPGSFTGIRIGLSVARAFALAQPLVSYAVSTLELLAWQAYRLQKQDMPVIAAINAYRGEIYLQSFIYSEKMIPQTEAFALAQENINQHIPALSFLKAGDAQTLIPTGILQKEGANIPDAAALAEYVACHTLLPNEYLLQPLYIRPPDAKPQIPLLSA